MSLNKHLISKKDHGVLATSWIAGTNSNKIQKIFKYRDIESIDVTETCQKISTFIEQSRKTQNNYNEIAPQEPVVPLRILTNLFYGTIRIYQQQVLNLFERTKHFAAESTFKIREITAIKRKSSCDDSCGAHKKPRLKSNEETIITNFTDLLHESENIRNLTETLFESNFSTIDNSHNSSGKKKKPENTTIQIREITIREINVDYGTPELDDEELDFGTATVEEQEEFQNIFNFGNYASKTKKVQSTVKCRHPDVTYNRELFLDNERHDIISDDDELSLEIPRNHNEIEITDHLSLYYENTSQQEQVSSSRKNGLSLSMQLKCASAKSPVRTTSLSQGIEDEPITNIAPQQKSLMKRSVLSNANEIPISEINCVTPLPYKRRKLNPHLVFDNPTTLPKHELCNQLDEYKTFHCWSIDQMKGLPKKITKTRQLFSTLNRSSKVITFDISKKMRNVRVKTSNEFLDIFNDIIGHSMDSQLVGELCGQCEKTFPSSNRRKRKGSDLNTNIENQQDYNIICNESIELLLDENNNASLIVSNEKSNDFYEKYGKRFCLQKFREKFDLKHRACDHTSGEIDTFTVIVRLLDNLRQSKNEFVDGKSFLQNSSGRKAAALSFYALLELAKNKFIIIKNNKKTSEIEKIFVGPELEKLIDKSQVL